MIVLDASVIIPGLLADGASRALLIGDDVHVPHLADSELVHGLRASVRRGTVPAAAAGDALARWAALGVRRHAARRLLPRIWALRDALPAYDATYVALAELLGCPLATGDRGIARAAGIRCAIVTPPT
ncbi:MAG TPA: type II toxin-antitoxin system VapC family toxin [Miltoncostaeaceae bacterium]|nr:type II toxin-antitoxin system VapC family toxin [Miltoncostaeaceae bacterium]